MWGGEGGGGGTRRWQEGGVAEGRGIESKREEEREKEGGRDGEWMVWLSVVGVW